MTIFEFVGQFFCQDDVFKLQEVFSEQVMADKNTENENGDDLGHGSQRKNIMDEGKEADKDTNEMNKHENWTRNGKPNRNANRDERDIIILKKRRSNTEKAKTPSAETDFLTQVPAVSSCEHREGGYGWTGTAEMRRSLVESLDDNI
jgi:hypothetical protein